MKIRFFSLALALLALALSSAFAQPKAMPDYSALGVGPGQPGGTLTMSLGDAPPSFFYYAVIDANLQTLAQQVFDSLLEFDLETYELEPGLAESWEVEGDGTVYTFHLREGVLWHDGEPFTSEDVVFTYEQVIMNPEARADDAAQFVYNVDGEEQRVTVEAVDDMTVRFTLPAPSAAFLIQQRFFMMPKHKLLEFSQEGGADAAAINNAWPTDSDPREVVGTGPLKMAGYTAGQLVSLEKNPDYWKEDSEGNALPYVDRLELLIVRGGEAQVAQFLAGNLDVLNISGAQFPDLKSRELAGADFHVVESEALFGSPPHLAFNFDAANPALAEVFADVQFRRAMEYAVDRMRIIDDVYNGLATLPGTPTAPANTAFYRDTTGMMRMFDLDAAAAALDELGLTDEGGDGVRNLDGQPLEFTLTYNVDSPVFTDIATILQNDFSQIGVRVNLQGVQGSALVPTALAGDFEAIIVAFGNQPDPELRTPIWQPGGALYYWHRATQPAAEGSEPNMAAMADWERRIWEIFDEGARLNDQERRAELYGEWQELNAEYLPVIMIAKPANIAAAYNRVGNFVYSLGVIPGYNPVVLYTVNE
ncbi:ABC transporter substrate-binding protein [soil metagenome]